MKQLVFDFAGRVDLTLDNFVVGRNVELVERVRALAARGGEHFIYLWGSPGSGRTHLLKAALALLAASGASTAYVGCGLQSAFTDATPESDALAVDDVERLSQMGQIALFNVYNALRESGRMLIAAGNAPPVQLGLRPDLVTRLGWGLVYQVHALTDAEKSEALEHHATARGFSLQPEVRQYLLTRVQRDMPSLLTMLDALDRYSLEAKRPITVPLLRELLEAERREERGERHRNGDVPASSSKAEQRGDRKP